MRHGKVLRGDAERRGVAPGEGQDLPEREPEVGDDGAGDGLRGQDRHQETGVRRPGGATPKRSARPRQGQGATRGRSRARWHWANDSGSRGRTITEMGRRAGAAITARSGRRLANACRIGERRGSRPGRRAAGTSPTPPVDGLNPSAPTGEFAQCRRMDRCLQDRSLMSVRRGTSITTGRCPLMTMASNGPSHAFSGTFVKRQ
jgi:hypothetical protein